jgi:hypothetical protein
VIDWKKYRWHNDNNKQSLNNDIDNNNDENSFVFLLTWDKQESKSIDCLSAQISQRSFEMLGVVISKFKSIQKYSFKTIQLEIWSSQKLIFLNNIFEQESLKKETSKMEIIFQQ